MEGSSNADLLSASNTNVSNFVSLKLSGSHNYFLWKAQMLCLLESNNMCGIVDAALDGPGDFGKKTMRRYDSLAKGWIFGSVSEDMLAVVLNLGSAKEVWEKLKSIFDPTMPEDSTSKKPDAKTEKEDIAFVWAEIKAVEGGENSIDIATETQTKVEDIEQEKNTHKKDLREAIIKRHWYVVRSILKAYPYLATEVISGDGSTILHMAIGLNYNKMVKKLFSYIKDERVFQKRDIDGSTPLHIAAIVGNKYAADLLVKKNKRLLLSKDHKDKEPLHKAYENMHPETVAYLLNAINDDTQIKSQSSSAGEERVVELLVNAISAKEYSLASMLVQKFPKFASESDDVLMTLTKTFPSGLNHLEAILYPTDHHISMSMAYIFDWIAGNIVRRLWDVVDFVEENVNVGNAICNQVIIILTKVIVSVLHVVPFALGFIVIVISCIFVIYLMLYYIWWKYAMIHIAAPFKEIDKKEDDLEKAKKLLELICDEIDLRYSGTDHPHYSGPILEAARRNAYEVVDEILFRSPEAIKSKDKKSGYDIIHLAIINRSEKIYNLIYDNGKRKNVYRTYKDISGNNIVHLAGRLAPSSVLNQITGATLQLQRELQWCAEVKKIVFPTYVTQENNSEETPDMIFTKEHENLVKEGEKWMKTTAESCSITAALITTVVFAAAITVPGGNDDKKGTPVFKTMPAFTVFAIFDAISLFASTTALWVFLSILTARFAEKDFLVSLPRRLFIGLFSLLLSTTAMMGAFSATLYIVFCDDELWILGLICGLAFIPIAFFVGLQVPLMVDLFMSTYVSVFGKRGRSERRFNVTEISSRVGENAKGTLRRIFSDKKSNEKEGLHLVELQSPVVQTTNYEKLCV